MAADWLIAMDRDPPAAIPRGGVKIGPDGKIVAVAPVGELVGPGDRVDYHDSALLTPGLINSHAHLDLSYWKGRRERLAGKPLHEWVGPVMAERAARSGDEIAAATAAGARASLAAGVTTVVDVTPGRAWWPAVQTAVAAVRVRRLALIEFLGFGPRGQRLWSQATELLAAGEATLRSASGDALLLGMGLSPHAPYSTSAELYARALEFAATVERDPPGWRPLIMTHLSETPEEIEFTQTGGGAWRRVLEQRYGPKFAAAQTVAGCSPIRFAWRVGLLNYAPALLAHVNYLTAGDLELLAHGAASVVYCPRTAEFFGHRDHPWRQLSARGVKVTVGTDSLASSPDLSVLAELRFLRRRCPQVRAAELFGLATRNAAAAIGLPDLLGAIKPGACADLAAWPIGSGADADAEALLADLLNAAHSPRAVYVGGRIARTPGRVSL